MRNECPPCSNFEHFLVNIGYEALFAEFEFVAFGWQKWEKSNNVWAPRPKVESFQDFIVELYGWLKSSRYSLHKEHLINTRRYLKLFKSFPIDQMVPTTMADKGQACKTILFFLIHLINFTILS
jgi:hypothetical protein